MYTLYNYFRSSAAFRVRIALNLKKLPFDVVDVHLVEDGGAQNKPEYKAQNPQGLVPMLQTPDGNIVQSLTIIDYLEQKHPKPELFPQDIKLRAYVQSLAQMVACDIHPLNNLRVLQYLTNDLNVKESKRTLWYHHWIAKGFEAIETWLHQHNVAKNCCFENQPTMADLCLIPQVYNAYRFECPMDNYPTIRRIYEHCMLLEPFKRAAP